MDARASNSGGTDSDLHLRFNRCAFYDSTICLNVSFCLTLWFMLCLTATSTMEDWIESCCFVLLSANNKSTWLTRAASYSTWIDPGWPGAVITLPGGSIHGQSRLNGSLVESWINEGVRRMATHGPTASKFGGTAFVLVRLYNNLELHCSCRSVESNDYLSLY